MGGTRSKKKKKKLKQKTKNNNNKNRKIMHMTVNTVKVLTSAVAITPEMSLELLTAILTKCTNVVKDLNAF